MTQKLPSDLPRQLNVKSYRHKAIELIRKQPLKQNLFANHSSHRLFAKGRILLNTRCWNLVTNVLKYNIIAMVVTTNLMTVAKYQLLKWQ